MTYMLTGPVHSGKTSFLQELTQTWKEKGFNLDGFLSVAQWQDKKHIGYDLFDLKNEQSIPFIRKTGHPGWTSTGPYFFIPQGLRKAGHIINRGYNASLLVVDEIGPLEMEGKGLWPALKKVIFSKQCRILLVVRNNILGEIKKKLKGKQIREFNLFTPCLSSGLSKEIFNQKIS